MPRLRRVLRWLGLGVLTLALFLAVTLAVPMPSWRLGRIPVPPLALETPPAPAEPPGRIWIDTDAACGVSARTDPDDCLALSLLLRAPGVRVIGISTVFGNAELAVTDAVTRDLVAQFAPGTPVHTGAAQAGLPPSDTPAWRAIRQALAEGPLTIVALGPLTNIAAVLEPQPDLRAKVDQVIAVMGRRPGHIFHPAEGEPSRLLFGHGPVFRDLNFALDPAAAAAILRSALKLTLLPYDVARHVSLTAADLDRMRTAGPALQWVVGRSEDWLEYWRRDIGRDGFYPFDLMAAAYALAPQQFQCAVARAWIAPDQTLWYSWFYRPEALLVGRPADVPQKAAAQAELSYCPFASPGLHAWLLALLSQGRSP